jgi:hypothetical protein
MELVDEELDECPVPEPEPPPLRTTVDCRCNAGENPASWEVPELRWAWAVISKASSRNARDVGDAIGVCAGKNTTAATRRNYGG